MQWSIKKFEDLSNKELYNILKLRAEVFIVEQTCPYIDPDDKDFYSLHVLGKENDEILAYTRIVFPGVSYDTPSIGRVVTSPKIRRNGSGRELMKKSLEYCSQFYPGQPVTISAQSYLEKFYQGFGFKTISEPYSEDDILHVNMKLEANG